MTQQPRAEFPEPADEDIFYKGYVLENPAASEIFDSPHRTVSKTAKLLLHPDGTFHGLSEFRALSRKSCDGFGPRYWIMLIVGTYSDDVEAYALNVQHFGIRRGEVQAAHGCLDRLGVPPDFYDMEPKSFKKLEALDVSVDCFILSKEEGGALMLIWGPTGREYGECLDLMKVEKTEIHREVLHEVGPSVGHGMRPGPGRKGGPGPSGFESSLVEGPDCGDDCEDIEPF